MIIDTKKKEIVEDRNLSGVVTFIGWPRLIACLKNATILNGNENVTDVHINKNGLMLVIEREYSYATVDTVPIGFYLGRTKTRKVRDARTQE